jgi:hypothetical protein
MNTGMGESPVVVVGGKLPEMDILIPEDLSVFKEGSLVAFRGTSFDMEDGLLPPDKMIWQSSRDGYLGSGNAVEANELSPGLHTIMLIGVDTDQNVNADSITITIEEGINSQPVANAGPDWEMFPNGMVTLDGSGSSDADGDTLTYQWMVVKAPVGGVAALSDAMVSTPQFSADMVGEYEVALVVHDGEVGSFADVVRVTVGDWSGLWRMY